MEPEERIDALYAELEKRFEGLLHSIKNLENELDAKIQEVEHRMDQAMRKVHDLERTVERRY